MPCKCGHGSKEHVCNDCVCAKKRKPCEPSCHCRTAPGIKCNNPYSKHSSSSNYQRASNTLQRQPSVPSEPQPIVVYSQP
eukprot:scaffold653345_cov61-Prasinocladus_malaysianus.AAC.1